MYMCARLKLSYQSRLELSVGNEVLRVVDDRRLVSAVPLRDRAVCTIYPYFLVYIMYNACVLYTAIDTRMCTAIKVIIWYSIKVLFTHRI